MIVSLYNFLLLIWIILFIHNAEKSKPFGFIIHAILSFILAVNGSYLEIYSADLTASQVLSYPYLTWFFFAFVVIDVIFAFYYFFKPAEEVVNEFDKLFYRR